MKHRTQIVPFLIAMALCLLPFAQGLAETFVQDPAAFFTAEQNQTMEEAALAFHERTGITVRVEIVTGQPDLEGYAVQNVGDSRSILILFAPDANDLWVQVSADLTQALSVSAIDEAIDGVEAFFERNFPAANVALQSALMAQYDRYTGGQAALVGPEQPLDTRQTQYVQEPRPLWSEPLFLVVVALLVVALISRIRAKGRNKSLQEEIGVLHSTLEEREDWIEATRNLYPSAEAEIQAEAKRLRDIRKAGEVEQKMQALLAQGPSADTYETANQLMAEYDALDEAQQALIQGAALQSMVGYRQEAKRLHQQQEAAQSASSSSGTGRNFGDGGSSGGGGFHSGGGSTGGGGSGRSF